MTKLIPKGSRLLVRSVFDTQSPGGIHIPQVSNDRRKVAKAEVIAVGEGVAQARGVDGDFIDGEHEYAIGDIVFFMVGSATAVDHEGETFLLVKTDEVLAGQGPEEPSPEMLLLEGIHDAAEVTA